MILSRMWYEDSSPRQKQLGRSALFKTTCLTIVCFVLVDDKRMWYKDVPMCLMYIYARLRRQRNTEMYEYISLVIELLDSQFFSEA